MTTEFQYKQNADGIQIEYELIPFSDLKSGEKEIDDLLAQNEIKIQKLTKEIQDLSVNCDNWDYSIAALSGVITGLIDIFFVGGIDLDPSSISEYHEIGKEGVEKAIKKAAKMTGFKNEKGLEGNELIQKSIEHLQNNFNLPADQATSFFGGGLQHHLRDFAHHPTLFGLVCSILSQLTGISIGTNTAGVITFTRVTKYRGKNIFEQLFFGIFYWMLHLLSDIDGTSFSAGKGTGIPGVLLSLLKEMDGVRNLFGDKKKETADELSVFITKLFNGSEFSEIGPDGKKIYHRFDYRRNEDVCEVFPTSFMEVDEMIQPAIIKLNRKGYYTAACCEGHDWCNDEAYVLFKVYYKFPIELPELWYSEGKVIRLNYKSALQGNENFEDVKKRKIKEFIEWVDRLPERKESFSDEPTLNNEMNEFVTFLR